MMEEGFACVQTTQLKGRTVLRICPIHPETTEDDIRHTIQRMYQYARALKKERVPNFSGIMCHKVTQKTTDSRHNSVMIDA